ncbi:alpha/beta hydrolase family protein [Catellatospora methionotrophica]|uniref:alpha/beta hydrolase family protein n=1 Tax=Catellatospora methionotrophica TaxID=121620 RepID=UPI003404718F
MQLTVDRGSDRLGVQLHPAQDPAAPLIVVFPAMGVPAGYYTRFAHALNAAGLGVAVADLRGTGTSAPPPSRASRYGYPELADDVDAVLDALAEHRAGRRTILLGHSLGGQVCVLHLAREAARGAGHSVDGLVLIAVGLPYWRAYPRRGLGVLAMTQFVNAVSGLLRVWPGWGFGGRQARGVIKDWAFTARRGSFPAHLGATAGLAAVDLPVLAISVDDDQYTPPETTDHLVAALTGAKVRREHLTAADAAVPLDHFKWVKAGAALAPRITAWLPIRH